MLYTIAVILLIAWLLGFVGIYTIGAVVHVLLVAALVLFVVGLLSGRSRRRRRFGALRIRITPTPTCRLPTVTRASATGCLSGDAQLLRRVRDVGLRSGIRGISTSPARYVRVSSSVEATRVAPVSRSTCVLSSASADGPQRPTRIRNSGNAARSLLTR